jgi:O-antigen/teichoic acid export membrane protein
MATRLLTVPAVIQHLGLSGYGIWNIVMMTATYMRFGSVGLKTAYQKYVAEATGDGDYDRASSLLSTGSAVMLVISIVGLIPVALLAKNIARWTGVPPEFLDSTAGSISLLAVIMGMSNVSAAYEATVMGAHRIDLARKASTILSILEAMGILAVIYSGSGLMAMSCVMGVCELAYVSICCLMSRRVAPEIHIRLSSVRWNTLPELCRFAGSYQLVNVLEILYTSLLPFAILRTFGATSAGVYAVIVRVVGCASVLLDAFLPSISSAGTMVYASGSDDRMQALLIKAFKVTLGVSLFPLGFIAVFGPTVAQAWTGATDPAFRVAFWLVSARGLFYALSLLALVLYRVSGRAFLDNLRQVLRIALILGTVLWASKLGFYGVLIGMGVAELGGMLFMLAALTRTFSLFRIRALLPDTARVTAAAAVILGAGVCASYLPVPGDLTGRLFAAFKLAEISGGCLLATWPALRRTGAITDAEQHAVLGNIFGKHSRTAAAAGFEY